MDEFEKTLNEYCRNFNEEYYPVRILVNDSKLRSQFYTNKKLKEKMGQSIKTEYLLHGTGKDGMVGIMVENFDPKRKSGQLYGPGYYFSKDIGIAKEYSKNFYETK